MIYEFYDVESCIGSLFMHLMADTNQFCSIRYSVTFKVKSVILFNFYTVNYTNFSLRLDTVTKIDCLSTEI